MHFPHLYKFKPLQPSIITISPFKYLLHIYLLSSSLLLCFSYPSPEGAIFMATSERSNYMDKENRAVEAGNMKNKSATFCMERYEGKTENFEYTHDGSVNFRGRPAIKGKTGGWGAGVLLLGLISHSHPCKRKVDVGYTDGFSTSNI